jgi:RNA polymerase sigma-70 factor (ECF subfamily)
MRRHERPLVRYATRLLGDVDAARDVVQDCFLRLCRQSPEELDGHLRPWLFTVCRHRALDLLRKAGRMETLDRKTDALARDDARPEADLEQREEAARVRDVLAALPERQQEVVRLKFQEDLSYKEIAAITGTSVSNVGYILHHALRALRSRLAANEGSQA